MILKYQFTLGGVGATVCGNVLSVISSIRIHRYIGIIQLFKLDGQRLAGLLLPAGFVVLHSSCEIAQLFANACFIRAVSVQVQ